jgi:hypothetical protein
MHLREYIPIIFNGGSYGSFLHYILDIANTNDDNSELPFTVEGGSHKFKRNLLSLSKLNTFNIKKHNNSKFIKYHPKRRVEQNLSEEINRIANITNKAILIYPSKNHKILTINNYFFKIWNNWFDDADFYDVGFPKGNNPKSCLYTNWGISENTPFSKIPKWIQREFISYYLFPAWDDYYEWYFLETYSHPNLLIVTSNELLYNFIETISNVLLFCDIPHIRNLNRLDKVHCKMMNLQQHINSDIICKNIIDSFSNNTNYEFNNLSLIDEAWIQYTLRGRGYELRCDGLNEFPKTVKDLIKHSFCV